ncbi:MAG: hypothetical protein II777_00445 [Clostridia bacterium]|nr:hypothetical protein [Clostridia bacterium]
MARILKPSVFLRRAVCALLCFMTVASFAYFDRGINAMNSIVTHLYDENAVTAERLVGNTAAVQFCVTKPIKQINIRIEKADKNGEKGSLYAELYKWDKNYSVTLRNAPVHGAHITEVTTGDDAEFKFDPVPAGEYLLYLYGAAGNLHIGLCECKETRTYFNASEHPLSIAADVVWDGERGGFGPLTDNVFEFVESFDTWAVTDGLGRKVSASETDTRRENKTVGIFFHTWHSSNSTLGSRNIMNILKEHPEIQNDFSSPLWGTAGAYHWNEPIWGYYQSRDEWVLRKQAELLADAGIDAVFFDNTNGTATFIDDVLTLCRVWSQARADGVKTPKISFMLPMFDYDLVAIQLREIYDKLYGKGIYKDLWFYWKGKPLMVGYPGKLDKKNATDKEILDFFNYRVINHSQSADNVQVQDEDGNPLVMGAIQPEIKKKYQLWNWISVYPQLVNKNKDGTPEQVSVAIAHNWCKETHLTAMNNPKFQVYGRHYDPVKEQVDERENAKLYGAYFSAQWEYALEIDPEFVWVTGWNEWVAGRFDDFWGVKNAFPDNFSDEYSRDIEPSRGDLKDHYYYQLVSYVRRYKGVGALPAVDEPVTVDIKTGSGWEKVSRTYETYPGDTFDRSCRGYMNNETKSFYTYKNDTGRNDIVSSKATYDAENLYFSVQTKDDLTPYTDKAWMRLFLEVEEADGKLIEAENWESFQYILNRNAPGASQTALEKSKGGWEWQTVGQAGYSVKGNTLQISVPRKLLGIDGCRSFTVNFKWADNMQNDGDILDFYDNGDVAPEGRFKYRLAVINAPVKASLTETAAKAEEKTEAVTDDIGKDTGRINPAAIIIPSVAAAAVGIGTAIAISKKKKK